MVLTDPRKIEVQLRHGRRFHWYYLVVNTRNHSVLSTSETYHTKWNARRAAKKFAADSGFNYREQ